MTDLSQLSFFATGEHECSYLPDEMASTMFADPNAQISLKLYTELSSLGFRRSGQHYYRPHCESCQACTPIRVNADTFKPSRSQKRVLNKNRKVVGQMSAADFHEDHYLLYEKYILKRHADGDMYPPSRDQYRSFLVKGNDSTRFIEFTDDGQLIGVAVCDKLLDGLSAIYTFFDPDLEDRSLGTYAVLWQILEARRLGLDYLYLGYFIRQCRKMAYKNKFSPFEARINNQWLSEAQLTELAQQHQTPES